MCKGCRKREQPGNVPQEPSAAGKQGAKKSLQAKPIYTSPHKKGSYGFNLTTLSERKGAKGVVSL